MRRIGRHFCTPGEQELSLKEDSDRAVEVGSADSTRSRMRSGQSCFNEKLTRQALYRGAQREGRPARAYTSLSCAEDLVQGTP